MANGCVELATSSPARGLSVLTIPRPNPHIRACQAPVFTNGCIVIRCVVGWGRWVLPVINTYPAHHITLGRTYDETAGQQVNYCLFRSGAFAYVLDALYSLLPGRGRAFWHAMACTLVAPTFEMAIIFQNGSPLGTFGRARILQSCYKG